MALMENVVASNPVETAGGRTAWVEQKFVDQFAVICDGCRMEPVWRMGLAPALNRLVEHAEFCVAGP